MIKNAWARASSAFRIEPAGVVPLVAAALGILTALADIFISFDIPESAVSGVLIFAVSINLLWVYANSVHRLESKIQRSEDQTQNKEFGQRHTELLNRIEQVIDLPEVLHVESVRINSLLKSELSSTTGWWFRGGSGRWLRSTVLPELSKNKDQEQPVHIQILDPRDNELCQKYATYRYEKLESGDQGSHPTADAIREDLLACVLAAFYYSTRSPIRPNIVLLRAYSPLRIDMGSNALIATVSSKVAPGLMAKKDSFFFKSIKEEFQNAAHGHARIIFPDIHPSNHEKMTPQDVHNILSQCEVSVGEAKSKRVSKPKYLLDGLPNIDFDSILKKAFSTDEKF